MHLTNDVVAVVAIPKAQVEETPVAVPVAEDKAADGKAAPASDAKKEEAKK
jgi:hypothetical protein